MSVSVLTAAAFAATSAVAVTLAGPRPSQPPVRSMQTRLVDADSVLDIPVNLFDDIAHIPSNELQGIGTQRATDLGTQLPSSLANLSKLSQPQSSDPRRRLRVRRLSGMADIGTNAFAKWINCSVR